MAIAPVSTAGVTAARPQTQAKPTALESHVAFFAEPGKGTITHESAKRAIESLGYPSMVASVISTAILHGLSARQHDGDSAAAKRDHFNMTVGGIEKAKHPGSTGIFDASGAFNQARFDERFEHFDSNHDGALSSSEVSAMQKEDLQGLGFKDWLFGFIATKGEFGVLENVLGRNGRPRDANGDVLISRDDLLKFYKGDLFPNIAKERAARDAEAPKKSSGWLP